MFFGEHQHNLDVKNRIIIPAKFRQELGETFIITKGFDKCLVIYTNDEWDKLKEKVVSLPKADPSVRRFIRTMFGGAYECEPDTQGRVLIPQNLREYAAIVKEVVSVGVFERLEIWSRENWDIYNKSDTEEYDNDMALKIADLGI